MTAPASGSRKIIIALALPAVLLSLAACARPPIGDPIPSGPMDVLGPVPAFEPVCTELIRVDSPGSTCADMRKLHYEYRRKPMFPFEDI